MRNKFIGTCLTFIAISAIFSVGAGATPPNTTAANSVPYEVGQGWVTHLFDDTIQTRWFRYGEIGGNSYCVQAVQGSVSPVQLDPAISLFTDVTGTTPLVVDGATLSNNDGLGEPYLVKGARICYIAPGTFGIPIIRSLRVNAPISVVGDAGNVKIKITNTTLVAMDMSANSQIFMNNVSTSQIKLRPTYITSGMAVTTGQFYAPTSLSTYSSDVLTIPFQWTIYRGSIFLAHNGTPESLVAGTVMNFHDANGVLVGTSSIPLQPRSK
jgi:hypothetical protein